MPVPNDENWLDPFCESRFTEAQIVGTIKEQEAGMPATEGCRKHGLSPATFYKLKARYGGMELSGARRLKALEDENARLKRLLADTMLDRAVLNDLLGKHRRHRQRCQWSEFNGEAGDP